MPHQPVESVGPLVFLAASALLIVVQIVRRMRRSERVVGRLRRVAAWVIVLGAVLIGSVAAQLAAQQSAGGCFVAAIFSGALLLVARLLFRGTLAPPSAADKAAVEAAAKAEAERSSRLAAVEAEQAAVAAKAKAEREALTAAWKADYLGGHPGATKGEAVTMGYADSGVRVFSRRTEVLLFDVPWSSIARIQHALVPKGRQMDRSSMAVALYGASGRGGAAADWATALGALGSMLDRDKHLVSIVLRTPDGFEGEVGFESADGEKLASTLTAQRLRHHNRNIDAENTEVQETSHARALPSSFHPRWKLGHHCRLNAARRAASSASTVAIDDRLLVSGRGAAALVAAISSSSLAIICAWLFI